MFLCGRNVLPSSIAKNPNGLTEGLVLVQNERDENLGYGKIIDDINNSPMRIVVKNFLDKGDFLRREMDSKK